MPPWSAGPSAARSVQGEPVQVPATFEVFYKDTKDQVLQVMLAVTGNRPIAEDATQEAFVRAYTKWEQLEHHLNPRSWVIRVALNVHRSWWRKRRREIGDPEALDSAIAHPPQHWADPEMMQALQILPAKQRAVVALRFLYDFTPKEVAEVLGLAEGTVWAHQHKAMRKLRTALISQLVVEEES
jgi:RNA polymerase sigma factor (sigma-70 family)